MREESRSKPRYLGIMDICHPESSTSSPHGPHDPSPKTTHSRKRHHSPGPRQADANNPKRTRTDHLPKPGTASTPTSKPKPPSNSQSSSPDPPPSRKRHNLVEKKYRHRLNSQFKKLLDILPTPDTDHSQRQDSPSPVQDDTPSPPLHTGGAPGISTASCSNVDSASLMLEGEDGRVSKGEVVDRARMYIRALEREHRKLVAERRELDLLWVERGGV